MLVAKWGNSLAVRLPKALVEELGLNEGDEISITAAKQKELKVAKNPKRDQALANMAQRSWNAPEGYVFDREEANQR